MQKAQIHVTCNNCSLDNICFPRGLSEQEIHHISQVIKPKKTLQKGEYIFHEDSTFKGVLAIKSGTAKLVTNDHHGDEHILNILLPGELLGFDGLYNDKYRCSAIALDTLSFCELPAQSMDELFKNVPSLTKELFRHSSEKMKEDKDFIILRFQDIIFKFIVYIFYLFFTMEKKLRPYIEHNPMYKEMCYVIKNIYNDFFLFYCI